MGMYKIHYTYLYTKTNILKIQTLEGWSSFLCRFLQTCNFHKIGIDQGLDPNIHLMNTQHHIPNLLSLLIEQNNRNLHKIKYSVVKIYINKYSVAWQIQI